MTDVTKAIAGRDYKGVGIPEYARPGATRLPRGGPDRVRFCVWYSRALDEGKDDEEARSHARGCLFLMYAYITGGIGEKLGPNAGGVPIEYLGEEDGDQLDG